MDPVIRFRSAVALAGTFPVLSGVDLEVEAGRIVLVSGANGAGKTSLLRACAGLLRVVAGQAEVLGADLVRDQRAVRRKVGMVGHATGLYDELSAVENVRFGLRAAGCRPAGADEALAVMGVSGRLLTTKVGALSAGQRRRVALALLVARDPELWLMDEPHAGLDADTRDVLDEQIRRAAIRGRTVLVASHETDRVQPLANSVVRVAGGAVTAPDTTGGTLPVAVPSVA